MKLILAISFAIIVIFSACKNGKSNDKSEKPAAIAEMQMDFESATDSSTQNDQKESPGDPVVNPDPDWDKKIIRTASLNLEVKDFKGYYARLQDQVRKLGGYIASEEQNQNEWKIENNVTIKIPARQFESAIALLTADIVKLNSKSISSQDVTGEYVDTKSRLEAKKRVRDRYVGLLNQAKNMTEILDVQSEINNIQVEIESATGRVAYLGHASSFSTITMNYYQVLDPSAKADKAPGFGDRVGAAFRTGWEWVRELFVGMVAIWPLLMLVLLILVIYRKKRASKTIG